MKRFLIRVAYDGTDYCGWQLQPGVATIEGVLNEALSKFAGENIKVIGASRTDAGVHSLGNAAVFDSSTLVPGDRISYAVNPLLPDDIRITESKAVADDFHPRHCDSIKTYEYNIFNDRSSLPTERLYSHWIPKKLNIENMKKASRYFIGEHDFKSFCASGSQAVSTIRTVEDIEIIDQYPKIIIRVKGRGFLYNMVRIMTGTLVAVGTGKMKPEYVIEIIEKKDRRFAGETLPAKGLFLRQIDFL